MNNIREKYLPIGTVVMLKEGKKKVMITGFCSIPDDDKTTIYDYSGCMYPEGFLSSNQIGLFNHDQIEQIYYLGFESEEEKEFKDRLNDLIPKNNIREIEKKETSNASLNYINIDPQDLVPEVKNKFNN